MRETAASCEIIFVDDGSTDESWMHIKYAAAHYPVRGLRLQKNCGQHTAIFAGLQHAQGDWIAVMDCDFQDPPAALADMYASAEENTDAVFGMRLKEYDSAIKKLLSALFYSALRAITGVKLSGRSANFGMYRRDIVEAALRKHKKFFFFPAEIKRYAKNPVYLDVLHQRRRSGRTAYSFFKAWRLAMRVLAGNSVFSFLVRRNDVYVAAETINIAQ